MKGSYSVALEESPLDSGINNIEKENFTGEYEFVFESDLSIKSSLSVFLFR